MIDEGLVRNLGIIVVAGCVCALLARRAHLPGLVAFLLAGLVLGPVTHLVEISESLQLITELGIVLLLFLVGLELSFSKIRDVGKVAFIVGLSQIIFTALGGFLIGLVLGLEAKSALFLGAAITFSSTVVGVKLLAEKSEFDSLYGRITVGVLLVQDLVVIILLTFLTALGGDHAGGLGVIGGELVKSFVFMGILLAAVMLASRFALPRPFAWAARSPDTIFIWSLCWCFVVVLAAHLFHLSAEIGGFLAGVSLAQLPYSHDLRRRVHPLMNLFVAVFFVSLGVNMDLSQLGALWLPAVVVTAFVLVAKPAIVGLTTARLGYGERTCFLAGNTLGQISEFSFILAAMALAGDLIPARVAALVGLVGLLSIAASSLLIVNDHRVYWALSSRGWLKFFRAKDVEEETSHVVLYQNHIIIVDMNTLGRQIAQYLHDAGEKVLAIDTDPGKLAGLPCWTLLGNVTNYSVLEEAGLPRARLLVSALHIEDVNNLLAYRCRTFEVPCSIHAIDLSMVDSLLELDPAYLMLPKVDGIKLQNRKLKEMGYLTK